MRGRPQSGVVLLLLRHTWDVNHEKIPKAKELRASVVAGEDRKGYKNSNISLPLMQNLFLEIVTVLILLCSKTKWRESIFSRWSPSSFSSVPLYSTLLFSPPFSSHPRNGMWLSRIERSGGEVKSGVGFCPFSAVRFRAILFPEFHLSWARTILIYSAGEWNSGGIDAKEF